MLILERHVHRFVQMAVAEDTKIHLRALVQLIEKIRAEEGIDHAFRSVWRDTF